MAGLQADLHTLCDMNVHGCSVVTAVTAQNSRELARIDVVSRETLRAQLDALAKDIPADALKIGMLGDSDLLDELLSFISCFDGVIVFDPVLATTTGGHLFSAEEVPQLTSLIRRTDVLTPNAIEAEQLSGIAIGSAEDVERVAEYFLQLGARSVLIKGGHFTWCERGSDFYSDGIVSKWLHSPCLDSEHTRGTGCSMASAIAAALAQGYDVLDAVVLAKMYVSQGIRQGYSLGHGSGPIAHTGWPYHIEDLPRLSACAELPTLAFAAADRDLGLYPVVDSVDWIAKLLPLGIKTIQLRIKGVDDEVLRKEFCAAVDLQRQYDARLYINDHWALAIELGAYGVHLGQEDLDSANLPAIANAGLRLGVSTHSYAEIARAHAVSPSYIAIGPIYSTMTKAMQFAPQGLNQLEEWVAMLRGHYPLTAIGGISEARVPAVLATGVGSCAMVSAITQSSDYRATVKRLVDLHPVVPVSK